MTFTAFTTYLPIKNEKMFNICGRSEIFIREGEKYLRKQFNLPVENNSLNIWMEMDPTKFL